MRYLPINIDTKNKSILIVGGGNVALRRCKKLLDTEFKIFIVSMEFDEKILELAENNPGRIVLRREKIESFFDLSAYDYLIIATNNSEANSVLEKSAQVLKIPYVRSDKSENSTFIMNKVITNGDITIGISTGGNNPTIAKIIGEEISKVINQYNPKKLEILNDIRAELLKKNVSDINIIIRDLFYKEIDELEKYLEEISK